MFGLFVERGHLIRLVGLLLATRQELLERYKVKCSPDTVESMVGRIEINRIGSFAPPYITTSPLNILRNDFRKNAKGWAVCIILQPRNDYTLIPLVFR